MTTGKWIVSDSKLLIKTSDGKVVVPAANEVFSAAFKGVLSLRDITLDTSPQKALPHLMFSRFPLDIRIKLDTNNSRGFAEIIGSFVGLNRETQVPLGDLSGNEPDHTVSNNIWYPFAQGSLNELMTVLRDAGVQGPGRLTLREYLKLRQLMLRHDVIVDGVLDSVISQNDSVVPLPEGFVGTLYPYQDLGYKWLKMIAREEAGCILADEMGLGKTVQVIALLASELFNSGQSIIIAPSSLLENWRREILKFCPSLSVLVHQGIGRTGFPSIIGNYKVIITSYETAVRDSSLLKMIDWDIVVVDEAQAIKNPYAKRTRVVKDLNRRVSIAVTGTPVENHIVDLWSLVDFAFPCLLGSITEFKKSYVDEVDSASAVEPIVSPIILRRRVSDVAKDLPPRIDIPQPLIFSNKEGEEYERVREEALTSNNATASLVSLTKLRMYCAHPFLVSKVSGDPNISTKYNRFLEIVEEIVENNEKFIVFSSYTQMLDIISKDIKKRFGIPSDFIDGRVPVEQRQQKIDDFSKVKSSGMLVLNPRAAGVGLNITAANHVIHYNLEWNPALEDQASARSYRRGQNRPVTIHRLFYVSTVEEVIDMRMERKRQLANAAIVGTDGKKQNYVDLIEALNKSPIVRSDYHL